MPNRLSSHFAEFTLAKWLSYIEKIHAVEIDMGLDRISKVLHQLAVNFDFATVITVAGTNGKGTTCAFMENAFLSDGKTVAVYSSPHIERFNERLRINKVDVDDDALVAAFSTVEQARGDISLTYYEYTTLAAFLVLMEKRPDVIILEVGLGGRLDATNVIDADIAIITTVDLDHQAFLGTTREAIAVEKAGIMRPDSYAVIGDTEPPTSLLHYIDTHQVNAFVREVNFAILQSESGSNKWIWKNSTYQLKGLITPFIPRDNVATALMALSLAKVELDTARVNEWILQTQVAGRTELFDSVKGTKAHVMLDVGHNPQAARYLASVLRNRSDKKVHAVFGMLKDKDIASTYHIMKDVIDEWYFGSLTMPRGATAEEICKSIGITPFKSNCFDNIDEAFKMAQQCAQADELILVFGSFFTVADVRRTLTVNA